MAIDTRHPSYQVRAQDWEQMTDTHLGARAVKEKGKEYLPPTSGMVKDGMNPGQPGREAYEAYKARAVFPNVVKSAVDAFVGIMHQEPANITLPSKLEPLRQRATASGEGLHTLLRRINEQQLLFGRFGLLAEAPDQAGPTALPFIAPYNAKSIINWDNGVRGDGRQNLELVVLDESEYVREADLSWDFKVKHRILARADVLAELGAVPEGGGATYNVATFQERHGGITTADWIAPQIAGKTLDEIPFVFINTNDLVPDVDDVPLLDLSNLALAIYRGEADYRQNLFMQGQETLVITGGEGEDKELRTGVGAVIDLPADGDAKFIGVSADGLAEQRTSLENDRSLAAEMGTKILDFDGGSSQQSGEALRIRVAARTTSLQSIAQVGAEGLAEQLRLIARWVGADEDEVSVEPNTDFAKSRMTGKELAELMKAKQSGAPISLQTIHGQMSHQGLTDMTFDEEQQLVQEEQDSALETFGGPGAPDEEEDEQGGGFLAGGGQ